MKFSQISVTENIVQIIKEMSPLHSNEPHQMLGIILVQLTQKKNMKKITLMILRSAPYHHKTHLPNRLNASATMTHL